MKLQSYRFKPGDKLRLEGAEEETEQKDNNNAKQICQTLSPVTADRPVTVRKETDNMVQNTPAAADIPVVVSGEPRIDVSELAVVGDMQDEDLIGLEGGNTMSEESKKEWFQDLIELVGLPKGSDTKEADEIRKELLQDKTLVRCRQLADKQEGGYYWSEGILFHHISDIDRGVVHRVVLPKVRQKVVLDRVGSSFCSQSESYPQ